MGFSLPSRCPIKTPPICTLAKPEQETIVENPLEPPTMAQDGASLKSNSSKKRVILVESEVRRSPRVKGLNG